MRTILHDGDGGHDDLILAFFAYLHPEVDLVAITIAGTGEVHGPNGAKNVADLCYMLGRPDIPIAYGSAQPCDTSGKAFPEYLRAMLDNVFEGQDVPTSPNPSITSSAVNLIRDTLLASDEPVTILATGPLTNIAEFIKAYPELAVKIEKVVIMGGAVKVKGNIEALDPQSGNQVAEWNIYADPKAADIVFTSGVPVTLVSLDATNQVPMTKEYYESLNLSPQPEIKLIYNFMKELVDHFGEEFFKIFYLWDPLAAMICVNPQIALTESMPILIDLETAQTKCVEIGTPGSAMINVVTHILNPESILEKFLDVIKSNLAHQRFPSVLPVSLYKQPQHTNTNENTLSTRVTP